MAKPFEQIIVLPQHEMLDFCGRNDNQLREIEKRLETRVVPRGNELKIIGDKEKVIRTVAVIEDMLELARNGDSVPNQHRLNIALNKVDAAAQGTLQEIILDAIPIALKRKTLRPLTPGQKAYVEAIRNNDIVFGIGPAGTGKTYLACAMAVAALVQQQVRRIILVRPAVEAGEKLGFLPGDLAEKINPYLRPLYDALYEMIELDRINNYINTGVIEVAPLAFMRGRTLNNAFVILDEAQNTRGEQMKMFLTRLGFDSKAVITGDITQIDLEQPQESGLVQVQSVLAKIEEIKFIYFDERDVVRHSLVQKVIRAYEEKDNRDKNAAPARNPPQER